MNSLTSDRGAKRVLGSGELEQWEEVKYKKGETTQETESLKK